MGDIHLTVAVCTRNRAAMLRECVQSILASCEKLARPWELVVVDNASTDETPDVLGEFAPDPNVRVVREERLGLSHARNTCVSEARGRFVAFIDDDVLVREDWAETLCAEFEAQGVAVMGGLLLPKWEGKPPWWLTEELHGPLGVIEARMMLKSRGYPVIFGGNLAFEREAVMRLGDEPFHASLGRVGGRLIGNEETYFVEQLWKLGAKIGFAEGCVTWHRVPRKRMTLRWFLRWHYWWGVSMTREAVIRTGKCTPPWWLGPDVLRGAAEALWFAVTLRGRRAVRSLLRSASSLGRLVEYARVRKTVDADPSQKR